MTSSPSERDKAIAALTAAGAPFEIIETRVRGLPTRVYAQAPHSMRDVLLWSRGFADRAFVIYEDERWTFETHFKRTAALAHDFRARGIGAGDRVAIGMRNYPEWLLGFWACQAIGAVAVPLNAWWTGEELAYALTDSQARLAVLDGERVQRLRPELATTPVEAVLACHLEGADPGGATLLEDALAAWRHVDALPEAAPAPDDDATILYTSGTTGRPKGAIGTHRNHVANLCNGLLGGAAAAVQAGAAPRDLPPPLTTRPGADEPQPSALQTFPFFHIGGLTGLYTVTATGTKVSLLYRWDARAALELIEREAINSLSGVPTVVRQLLETAEAEGRSLPSLGAVASGGAPVPPDLIERIGSQFERRVAPGNGYGLTETTSAVISNGGDDYLAHPRSVGKPVPLAEARIVADDGQVLGDDEIGELHVYGANIVRGYWNRPEATAESFTQGWFHTGDIGYRDPDGFYYVVDRKKDVVIRGGENVYCAEVEAVLHAHPSVLDTAVVGLPHRTLGEEVAAVVQRRPETTLDAQMLQTFAGERLARFKVPTRVFVRDEALPRTATGKVLKRDLRDDYADR